MPTDTPYFTRDPSLSSEVADQFGGGAGNAEQLINANALRYSEELAAAQLAAPNPDRVKELELDRKKVGEVAEIDPAQITSFDIRGEHYLVYGFEGPDGRLGKDVLLLDDDGKLSMPDRPDSPERAALRAQVESARKVSEARNEAEKLIEDARAEAAKILQEASAKAEEDRAKAAEEAAKDAPKAEEERAKAEADKTREASVNPKRGGK